VTLETGQNLVMMRRSRSLELTGHEINLNISIYYQRISTAANNIVVEYI
jgi:hypothetical protein